MHLEQHLKKLRNLPIERVVEKCTQKVYFARARRVNPFTAKVGSKHLQVFHRGIDADLFSVWQCFYRHQYEIPEPIFHPATHRHLVKSEYHRLLAGSRTPVIVDCGANIGASSLWFSASYPDAKIIAIEPNPANLALLRKNLSDKAFVIIDGAVSDRDGEFSLVDTGNGEMGHRISDSETGFRVQGFTLNTILDKYLASTDTPFILKVDIEGAESLLFQNRFWKVLDRFPIIIVEEHDFMMPGSSTGSNFFGFHSDRRRDFMFKEENIFSFDYRSLVGSRSATGNCLRSTEISVSPDESNPR